MARKLLGYIGVDSGQVMIGDPCYLDEFQSAGFQPNRESEPGEFSYQAACEASLSSEAAGMIGEFPVADAARAAVSDTGIGDGIFPVYRITNTAGEVTGLLVSFL
jgi:hypothetical protein